MVELLRQRSRPYLFSNTIAPAVVGGSLKAIELITASTELRDRLEDNTRFFRSQMETAGLDVLPGEHPIVPVMLGDAALAGRMAEAMLEKGVYVIGFSYPVVLEGADPRAGLGGAHARGPVVRRRCVRGVEGGADLAVGGARLPQTEEARADASPRSMERRT